MELNINDFSKDKQWGHDIKLSKWTANPEYNNDLRDFDKNKIIKSNTQKLLGINKLKSERQDIRVLKLCDAIRSNICADIIELIGIDVGAIEYGFKIENNVSNFGDVQNFSITGSSLDVAFKSMSEKYDFITGGKGKGKGKDSKPFCDSLMKSIEVPTKNGTKTIVVNKYLAEDIVNIFNDIYNSGFNVKTIHAYCYRRIKGTTKMSNHSYGVALDINAAENPYVRGDGRGTTNHDKWAGLNDDEHIRSASHPVCNIFAKYGWGWGGSYKDYMHFSFFNGG